MLLGLLAILLGAKDATRSRDAGRGSWPYYYEQLTLLGAGMLLGAPVLTTRSKGRH